MLVLAPSKTHFRTLLILGRVSNLPTVWSNCLAGWLLAGGGDASRFILLCLGATFLYLGGMFLNDAFDAQFDQHHRPERPIPSGAISAADVWQWGLTWLLLGCLSLCLLGKTTAILGILLAITILVYDAIHKIFAFSPIFIAACRLLLVLAAASAGIGGVTGLSLWSALVLAAYMAGLTYLSRRESTSGPLQAWPCLFLFAPVLLALIVNPGEYLMRAFLLCAIFIIWVLRCLRLIFWSAQRNIGRSVAGLLAGIVLIDLLAVGPDLANPVLPFFSLFALALLLQRFVPAT